MPGIVVGDLVAPEVVRVVCDHLVAQQHDAFGGRSGTSLAFGGRLEVEMHRDLSTMPLRRACRHHPLFDREDIYAFEDWWTRIQALIAALIEYVAAHAGAQSVAAREFAAQRQVDIRGLSHVIEGLGRMTDSGISPPPRK
jgi:hypothetical protein